MQSEVEPKNQNEPSTAFQIFIAILANFTGIASGIAMGFSAVFVPQSSSNNDSVSLDYEQISWIASVIYITNMLGSCIGGIIADAWGRRYCLLIGNGICLLGWILIVTAYYCLPPYQFIALLIGRLITGFSIGTANVTTVVYTAETSSLKFRSMLTTWTGLSSTIGIFLVYLLGYCFRNNWAIISIIGATFPFISFISIACCLPESQAWLDSQNNVVKIAKSSTVTKLHRFQDIDGEELTALLDKGENVSSNLEKIPFWKRILQRTCLIPISIIICYFFFLNFSGFFVIIAYASEFVFLLKIPIDPYLTICSFAAVRLIGAIFLSTFSENMGRRFASIISGALMTISMVSIVIYLVSISTVPEEKLNFLFWLPISLIWVFIFACTIGFATIPFAMVGEIFPLNIRGVASGISICLNSFFTFMVIKIYPSSLEIFGTDKLLLLYGLTSLIGTIFIVVFLPETKGKTLKEIEDYFADCQSLRKFRVLK